MAIVVKIVTTTIVTTLQVLMDGSLTLLTNPPQIYFRFFRSGGTDAP
jgi:hypothetical protein